MFAHLQALRVLKGLGVHGFRRFVFCEASLTPCANVPPRVVPSHAGAAFDPLDTCRVLPLPGLLG